MSSKIEKSPLKTKLIDIAQNTFGCLVLLLIVGGIGTGIFFLLKQGHTYIDTNLTQETYGTIVKIDNVHATKKVSKKDSAFQTESKFDMKANVKMSNGKTYKNVTKFPSISPEENPLNDVTILSEKNAKNKGYIFKDSKNTLELSFDTIKDKQKENRNDTLKILLTTVLIVLTLLSIPVHIGV